MDRRTVLVAAMLLVLTGSASAEEVGLGEQVAALKQSLQAGMAALRKYEWVETTTLSLKGEQKSSKQKQCYYGADGTLQKVPLPGESDAGKKPRGIRGKIAKHKKEGMTDYLTDAAALIKQYVPPDPARIQAAKDAGKASLHVLAEDRYQLQFRDYLKSGDVLSVYLDPSSNRPTGLRVSSYLEGPEDLVTLDVEMTALQDGAIYPSEIVLNGQSKQVKVNVRNSGHRLMNQAR